MYVTLTYHVGLDIEDGPYDPQQVLGDAEASISTAIEEHLTAYTETSPEFGGHNALTGEVVDVMRDLDDDLFNLADGVHSAADALCLRDASPANVRVDLYEIASQMRQIAERMQGWDMEDEDEEEGE